MNWKLAVTILVLGVIACGAPVGSLSLSENSEVLPTAVTKDTHITTQPSTAQMTVCNSGGLNVRYAPGDLSASIRQLKDGETVTVKLPAIVVEDMGLWYELADGGFVNARFLCEAE